MNSSAPGKSELYLFFILRHGHWNRHRIPNPILRGLTPLCEQATCSGIHFDQFCCLVRSLPTLASAFLSCVIGLVCVVGLVGWTVVVWFGCPLP